MHHCPICQIPTHFAFKAKVLRTHEAQYYQCPQCELLQANQPHWLAQAYENPIIEADTGILQRNIAIAKRLTSICFFLLNRNGFYVDIAGGYGLFVRLMRDYGFNFYWSDPYCENVFAKGFAAEGLRKPIECLTAFEVLEHVENPVAFLQAAMKQFECHTIIFSTELYDGVVPDPSWWYYAFDGGQHISFYTHQTLTQLAQRLGLHYISSHGLHCFSRQLFNKTLFSLLTSRWSVLSTFWVKKQMSSLTQQDSALMG